jgi:hypothetical protein
MTLQRVRPLSRSFYSMRAFGYWIERTSALRICLGRPSARPAGRRNIETIEL